MAFLAPSNRFPSLSVNMVSLTLDDTVPISDEDLLDQELLRRLETEHLPEVTLEQVRAALAKIPGSMTAAFLAEREERLWE